MIDLGSGLIGLASRIKHRALNMSLSVKDLAYGKKLECNDIVEMLAVEDKILSGEARDLRRTSAEGTFRRWERGEWATRMSGPTIENISRYQRSTGGRTPIGAGAIYRGTRLAEF